LGEDLADFAPRVMEPQFADAHLVHAMSASDAYSSTLTILDLLSTGSLWSVPVYRRLLGGPEFDEHFAWRWVRIRFDEHYQLVSGSRGNTIKFWDVATGQELRSFTGLGGSRCVAFSSDGKTVASRR
jgi:WD40 repeat protein